VGIKGRASEEAPKKWRVANGGVMKRVAMATTTGQPITGHDGRQEIGVVVGTVSEYDNISPKTTVDGSGVEVGGEGGEEENKESETRGLVDMEGGIEKSVSSGGGNLGGVKRRLHRGESDHVKGTNVGVLAENASLVESPGKVISS
jgi:hypothetical protein